MEMMREKIPFINTEIVKLPQPIDLYSAYGAYHFGIYKNIKAMTVTIKVLEFIRRFIYYIGEIGKLWGVSFTI